MSSSNNVTLICVFIFEKSWRLFSSLYETFPITSARDFIFLTTISNNKYFNKFFNKCFNKYYSIFIKLTLISQNIKVAAAEMKYFEKRKSSGSLIYKENLDLIWQIVHKLEYLFCEGR